MYAPQSDQDTTLCGGDGGAFDFDTEKGNSMDASLRNTSVHSFSWDHLCVHVKDRDSGEPRTILDNAIGIGLPGDYFLVAIEEP